MYCRCCFCSSRDERYRAHCVRVLKDACRGLQPTVDLHSSSHVSYCQSRLRLIIMSEPSCTRAQLAKRVRECVCILENHQSSTHDDDGQDGGEHEDDAIRKVKRSLKRDLSYARWWVSTRCGTRPRAPASSEG